MEIPTEAGALVRNDSVVRCPGFPLQIPIYLFRQADMPVIHYSNLYLGSDIHGTHLSEGI